MTKAEVKTELERIHGATNKPNDWTFNKFTDTIWDLLDGDEEQVEDFRATLESFGDGEGMSGIYEVVKEVLSEIAQPEEG